MVRSYQEERMLLDTIITYASLKLESSEQALKNDAIKIYI